jgi:hypothetical protein
MKDLTLVTDDKNVTMKDLTLVTDDPSD